MKRRASSRVRCKVDEKMSLLAAVRVRGVPDTRKKTRHTLETLCLHNKNNAVIVPDNDAQAGMLVQAKDYIAYGSVDRDTVESLLSRKGTVDGTALPDAVDELGYDSVSDLVDALEDGDVTIGQLRNQGLQVPFRLSPPSKGYRDTRRHYQQSGSLGERDDMDELLRRMM